MADDGAARPAENRLQVLQAKVDDKEWVVLRITDGVSGMSCRADPLQAERIAMAILRVAADIRQREGTLS